MSDLTPEDRALLRELLEERLRVNGRMTAMIRGAAEAEDEAHKAAASEMMCKWAADSAHCERLLAKLKE